MNTTKIGEFIDFHLIGDTGKTLRYAVKSKTGDVLANIQWFGAWRKYCLYPSANTIFDIKCLNEITNFITELMNNRKKL